MYDLESIVIALILRVSIPDPDPALLLALIRKWIPGTRLSQIAGSDMKFVLPVASGTCFPDFFRDLEAQKHDLGIVSYGISDPQLQEVCRQTERWPIS